MRSVNGRMRSSCAQNGQVLLGLLTEADYVDINGRDNYVGCLLRPVPSERRLEVFRIALAASVLVVALAAPSALASQGGKYHGPGDWGSRANITGAATVPSDGAAIATVRNQQNFADTTGLIQFGHLKQGASITTDCGTGTTVGYMVERKASGGVNNYVCNAFFGSFGSNHRFSVLKESGGWNTYLDGAKFSGPYTLGYTSGYAYTVGEYVGGAPSSFSFSYGPSGGTVWGYNDGTNWVTVGSATNFNEGGWNVQSLPCPFLIYR
jgi:hypothetical protein